MSNCPFCNLDAESTAEPPAAAVTEADRGTRFGRLLRRAWRSVQWIFPTALLVVMPKCPLCLAAYVALFTGIGITASTARWMQVLMVVSCSALLGYLVIRYWRMRFATAANVR